MLTRDVAGHGQALAMLVLEGGGDGVQPQEEKGLVWSHRTWGEEVGFQSRAQAMCLQQ